MSACLFLIFLSWHQFFHKSFSLCVVGGIKCDLNHALPKPIVSPVRKKAEPIPCLIHDILWSGIQIDTIHVASVCGFRDTWFKEMTVGDAPSVPLACATHGPIKERYHVHVTGRPVFRCLDILNEAGNRGKSPGGQAWQRAATRSGKCGTGFLTAAPSRVPI